MHLRGSVVTLKHYRQLVLIVAVVVTVVLLKTTFAAAQQLTSPTAPDTSNPQGSVKSLPGTGNTQIGTDQAQLLNSQDLTIRLPHTTPKEAPIAANTEVVKDKTIFWLTLTLAGGLIGMTAVMATAVKSQKRAKTERLGLQNANVSGTLVESRKAHEERKRRSKSTRRQRRSKGR